MKRFLPFVFPAAALMIVLFLAYRWYGNRTDRPLDRDQFAEGLSVEELSSEEASRVRAGAPDLKTVEMSADTAADGSRTAADGQIRYEILDGKVLFSVSTSLPSPEKGVYQVWLKDVDSEAIRKIFTLSLEKGGYMGSASISEGALPFEVVVSQEETDDAELEKVLMRGTIKN